MAVRILVVDDHEIVRRGLRGLLETQPRWQIIGEAANGRDAVEKAAELCPDMVILDISLPGDGLEAARRILQALPQTEVLILSYHDSPFMVRRALDAGARGYVLKSDAGHDLLAAVEAVSQHKPFLSPAVAQGVAGARDRHWGDCVSG